MSGEERCDACGWGALHIVFTFSLDCPAERRAVMIMIGQLFVPTTGKGKGHDLRSDEAASTRASSQGYTGSQRIIVLVFILDWILAT